MNKINITVANEKTNTGAKRKIAVFRKVSDVGEGQSAVAVSVQSIIGLTLSNVDESPLLLTREVDGRDGRIRLAGDFDEAVRTLARAVRGVAVFHKRTQDGRALPYAIPSDDIKSIDVSHRTGEALLKSYKREGSVLLAEAFDEAVRIWEAA